MSLKLQNLSLTSGCSLVYIYSGKYFILSYLELILETRSFCIKSTNRTSLTFLHIVGNTEEPLLLNIIRSKVMFDNRFVRKLKQYFA